MATALGIDPGLSGAIVLIGSGKKNRGLRVRALLDLKGTSKLTNGSYLDPKPIVEFLSIVPPPDIIVFEDVHVQGAGASTPAMFKFGQVKGLLSGLLHSAYPDALFKYVKPAVWKLSLGLSKDKGHSRALAKKTFTLSPDMMGIFDRVKDTDRAEAALLALCGLRMLGG